MAGAAVLGRLEWHLCTVVALFVDVRRQQCEPKCVRTFMKRPVKLPAQFEGST
jgi:hypothetical protein